MGPTVKIAVSLPAEMLAAIEQEREATGESRSAFLRRAVEAHLRHEREKEAIERYLRGYTEQPEDAAEMEGLLKAGLEALAAEEPWE